MINSNPYPKYGPVFIRDKLGPYNYRYPNVCVTGTFPIYSRTISSIAGLKESFYNSGLPRVSSTPLGMNSFYNRFPYINLGSYQTSY